MMDSEMKCFDINNNYMRNVFFKILCYFTLRIKLVKLDNKFNPTDTLIKIDF